MASPNKIVLVGDAAREPLMSGPVAYTRLRGLGDSRRLTAPRLDAVVNNLRGRREAYVVVETEGAVQVSRNIRAALMGEAAAAAARAPRQRATAVPLTAEDEEQE